MISNPVFSVITVCYNSEKTIERTIRSVISQTYRDFEYIIVDGASTDNTMAIVEKYAELYPEYIRYVSERDKGIYDAMNKGIGMANGKIIGLINSDDYYEPDALEEIARHQNNEKYAVYYGMIRVLNNGQERFSIINNHMFLRETMICHPAAFVTKAVYQDFGGYSLDYKSASDYDFMLRISQNGQVPFFPIYKILADFSEGGLSTAEQTGDFEKLKIQYIHGIISKNRYRKIYIRMKYNQTKKNCKSIIHSVFDRTRMTKDL